MTRTLEPLLREHKFFAGLDPELLAVIVGCASNVTVPAGTFLFREGDPADVFYLIRLGKLTLEVSAPGRGPLTVGTLAAGDMVGFSWLLQPHSWEFDGRVIERVLAIQMDGACLRDKCERDPALGYDLMRRFSGLAVARLQATRLQLLDVYGHAGNR